MAGLTFCCFLMSVLTLMLWILFNVWLDSRLPALALLFPDLKISMFEVLDSCCEPSVTFAAKCAGSFESATVDLRCSSVGVGLVVAGADALEGGISFFRSFTPELRTDEEPAG